MDGKFYAWYSCMIGPLSKIIRTLNSFKNVLRYFGNVWRESGLYILWFDWLIALYLFTPLPHNASFLIVKKVVSEKNSIMSTNHCAKTSFWRACTCASNRWFVHLPNWHFPLYLPPHSMAPACAQYTISNAWDLEIVSHLTSSQESLK